MKPNIFLAAFMKSGGTHICNCFQRLGYKWAATSVVIQGCENKEHEVVPAVAGAMFPYGGFVLHQHIRAIGSTVEILKAYDVKPVIVIRNLPDALLSFCETASLAKDVDFYGDKQINPLSLHAPPWEDLEDDDRLHWLLYNVVPWYLSFYASWRDAKIEKLWVSYEDFFADQVAGLRRILAHVGVNSGPQDFDVLEKVAAHTDGRFNVGRSGRGRENLPDWVLEGIEDQITSWGPTYFDSMRGDLL